MREARLRGLGWAKGGEVASTGLFATGRLGVSPVLALTGSGELSRIGEYSVEGKTGCMLEERPVGEPGLREAGGGGVADIARGDEWFEGSGERAGEDGRGELCSAGGEAAGRGDGRWMLMLCVPEPNSSTS